MSTGFGRGVLGDNLLEEEESTLRDAHNIYSSPDIISLIEPRGNLGRGGGINEKGKHHFIDPGLEGMIILQ